MAVGNTALSYQMMVEGNLMHAMMDSARANNYYIASAYALAYADFLGIDGSSLPTTPEVSKATTQSEMAWEYQKYYFKMLHVMFKHVRKVLQEVREKYRPNKDIPTTESMG